MNRDIFVKSLEDVPKDFLKDNYIVDLGSTYYYFGTPLTVDGRRWLMRDTLGVVPKGHCIGCAKKIERHDNRFYSTFVTQFTTNYEEFSYRTGFCSDCVEVYRKKCKVTGDRGYKEHISRYMDLTPYEQVITYPDGETVGYSYNKDPIEG